MKKEHYAYISEHFKLGQYSDANESSTWDEDHEGDVNVFTLTISQRRRYIISIADHEGIELFIRLPSEEFALAVIEHIKNSEILFV